MAIRLLRTLHLSPMPLPPIIPSSTFNNIHLFFSMTVKIISIIFLKYAFLDFRWDGYRRINKKIFYLYFVSLNKNTRDHEIRRCTNISTRIDTSVVIFIISRAHQTWFPFHLNADSILIYENQFKNFETNYMKIIVGSKVVIISKCTLLHPSCPKSSS